MKLVEFSASKASPITSFDSAHAASVHIADGEGETHVYCIHFEPGGVIGPHPTGFAQLFLVVEGSGWAAGADGVRQPLSRGQGVYFDRGELHSKGSDEGMSALMFQVDAMTPRPG